MGSIPVHSIIFKIRTQERKSFIFLIIVYINVIEHQRGNQQLTIQRKWQHRVHKTKKNKNTICIGHHYAKANTYNVIKT
jgi:quinolinate synthase